MTTIFSWVRWSIASQSKRVGLWALASNTLCSDCRFALWVHLEGRPGPKKTAYRDLLKRRKLTGPNFHALRHAHVSQLLKDGVDAKVISKRLGHARASFTIDVYAHLMPGQDEEAAKRTDAGLRRALAATARVAG